VILSVLCEDTGTTISTVFPLIRHLHKVNLITYFWASTEAINLSLIRDGHIKTYRKNSYQLVTSARTRDFLCPDYKVTG
jgi:hypothetical protein